MVPDSPADAPAWAMSIAPNNRPSASFAIKRRVTERISLVIVSAIYQAACSKPKSCRVALVFTGCDFTFVERGRARPRKVWTRSQSGPFVAPKLGFMGVKYYTHFVLTGDSVEGSDQEFSGVVEVNQPTEISYETSEIEALLARNFDLRSSDVRLINWSRLQ